jgi:hypothetical protein
MKGVVKVRDAADRLAKLLRSEHPGFARMRVPPLQRKKAAEAVELAVDVLSIFEPAKDEPNGKA